MLAVLIIVVAAIVVAVIAVGAVGRVASDLDAQPALVVLDVSHEVDWIAERLPREVTARLSHDEVKQILYWHLEFVGYARVTEDPDLIADFADVGVEVPDVDTPVAELDAAVDHVVERAMEEGDDLASVDVVVVLDKHVEYLDMLGALGPEVGDFEPGDEMGRETR